MNTLETLQEIDDPEAFSYHFKMAAANGITAQVARMWVDDFIKTKAGTYYDGDGGGPVPNTDIESKPVFVTCEVCHGPTEIKNVRNLIVCSECRKKVKHV